ncbi:MAG: DAK2 domain-containing protein [Clostridia bacterium]|nr:DAK2 domain-containing protein [Clostridia bacterium]
MGTKVLDGKLLEQLILGGAANLSMNAGIVNDLNVFPIPDGDTGDNMSLTVNGGVRALDGRSTEVLSDAASIISQGMLLSARGNSGVILSQFFAGISDGFQGIEKANVKEIAEAMQCGVKSAYASVITPTEGTILTVAREAVAFACERIDSKSTLESFIADVLKEMNESLQRTPDLLAALKEAGVIDSGGAGLYYIFDGMHRILNGETLDEVKISVPSNTVDLSKFDENTIMKFGYCTEFLLQLTHSKTDIKNFNIDTLIEYLGSIGDSIVAVQTGTKVKVHVHTLTPEKALSFCHNYGEFLTLKIENMTLQHHETNIENRFDDEPKKKFGIVTVATGEGIKKTLSDLCADVIIDGGQGKNPSAEDFVDAFNKVNAETIFVLPNNGNIIMAAKQAAELYSDSNVRVIESRSIGDGYAALTMLSYDSGDADEIENSLRDAMQGVITGMVTKAVRTTTVDGVSIKENDYIGFTDKRMLVSCESSEKTAIELAEKLNVSDYEYMIVIYGSDATEIEKESFREYMNQNHRYTELCEIEGNQEIYNFILILQ